MAKGQKRSNREIKKPKKTAAERAAGAKPATQFLAAMDKAAKGKQKPQ